MKALETMDLSHLIPSEAEGETPSQEKQNMTSQQTAVPILTVMPDYGNAPFLWINRDPSVMCGVGGNLCDGTHWHESCLMSEELWRQFSYWAIAFDRTRFEGDCVDPNGWDWPAFHERGLYLARLLKEEVGDAYQVIYVKPWEDPYREQDERTEILTKGRILRL